jgi:hypothetical protein
MDLVKLISDRKLNISYSKYIIQIIDPVTKMQYVEYHAEPQAHIELAVVHPDIETATRIAFTNCFNSVLDESGTVRTKPVEN